MLLQCQFMELLHSFFQEYVATLKEAFGDINDFIDTQIDSERGMFTLIAAGIAAPVLSVTIFFVTIYFGL